MCLKGNVDETPEEWGDRMRRASNHTGTYPVLSIFHGDGDGAVDQQNMTELMEQILPENPS
jgi:hypothetical protein